MSDVEKMLAGMEQYFLANDAISALIASRLSRVISETRIVAHDKPEQIVASRVGRWAEYELTGSERGKVLNGKSKFHLTRVDFRFFAQFPGGAKDVRDAFVDAFGTGVTKLSTRWGEGTDYETKVMGAHWDDATTTDDRDQTIGMSQLSATLVVPFCVV